MRAHCRHAGGVKRNIARGAMAISRRRYNIMHGGCGVARGMACGCMAK